MERKKALCLAAAGVGAGVVIREIARKRAELDLFGKVVLITGGSRGLGLALAREFGAAGAKLALGARDAAELERARQDLEARGAEVYATRCDVTDRAQVEGMIGGVMEHYGAIDVLVNNAGEIQVGPVESMTVEDFERAMDVMFWGTVHPAMTVLPYMLERHSGRIVNITPIGGKVAVPHLVPYDCAKVAVMGFSEGLRAELTGDGIAVVTIAPETMHTPSYRRAFRDGQENGGPAAVGLDAQRAARAIVSLTRRSDAGRGVVRPPAAQQRFHGLPRATVEILGLVNRVMLPALRNHNGKHTKRGSETRVLDRPVLSALTMLGRMAARRYLQP